MRHSRYATADYGLCNVKSGLFVDQAGYDHVGALMSREELGALTGTLQPKRMCAWLEARGWVYEPPARRGDIPKVLRAYRDARLSGIQPERKRKANYSFMTAGLL
ncbi:DUF4224 domain-containing protein [Agrobacterium sp.]|uniref:DUF4224 domain-containing protein n=1 Tax=Agrobacterium sp. TaxID=361 RepID=UPI0040346752